MVTVKDLQKSDIFKDFPPEDLAIILPSLSEKTARAGETIIYRGDPGNSLFIILDGYVDVTLINDEHVEYTIHKMGPGDNFGEMALITGEPRSANVKAVSDVRLAELFQEPFLELISAYPKLVDFFFLQLAHRRAKTIIRQQFANLERNEIIASLFTQQPPEIDCFIGTTKWTKDINAAILRLAATDVNVLLIGERGTGKDLAARLIHFHGPDNSLPLFHLDCANPPPIHRDSDLKKTAGNNELLLEIAQETALFGHGADAGSYAVGIRKGYLELADRGALILENVDALSMHAQQLLTEYIKNGTFFRTGENLPIESRTRIFTTVSRSLDDIKSKGSLNPELLTLAGGEILQMKPLRERKKDIPIIAEYLISEYNVKFSTKITGFTKEALNCLVDHDWPRNIEEMRPVLERAVLTSDDGLIAERNIFLNIPTFSATGKFNLLKIPFIRDLANHALFPSALRIVSVPFILFLILFTLFGPSQNNPANLVVWAVWWPFLIISIAFGARSWCAYCPMPTISDVINFRRKNFFTLPEAMARYGFWIGIGGFAIILLVEHAAHMFTVAQATGILLLSILSGVIITGMLYGRRSWCKHFCPLGKLVANASAISLLELGSNSNVCSSQCQTHDCIKDGNCPMGLHPSAAAISKDCIFCLSCLKGCRHQSVRINVRFPWYEFLVKEKWTINEAFFAVSLVGLILSVKLPPLERLSNLFSFGSQFIADMTVSLFFSVSFVILAYLASGFLFMENWKKHFAISGSSYIFLAFAALFNLYFHEFVYNGQNILPWIAGMTTLDSLIPAEWLKPELGTLKGVIPVVTILGGITSYSLLSRLSRKYSLPQAVYRTHQGIMLVTTLLFLFLL